MIEAPPGSRPQMSRLEIEVLNHYPDYGSFGTKSDSVFAGRRAFRTLGLPPWQLELIHQYPSLYLAEEDMGIADYCHLAYGFEVREDYASVISQLSEVGSSLAKTLRTSGAQPEARIAIVRVQQEEGRLKIRANDNLHEPFRTTWRSYVQAIEGGY